MEVAPTSPTSTSSSSQCQSPTDWADRDSIRRRSSSHSSKDTSCQTSSDPWAISTEVLLTSSFRENALPLTRENSRRRRLTVDTTTDKTSSYTVPHSRDVSVASSPSYLGLSRENSWNAKQRDLLSLRDFDDLSRTSSLSSLTFQKRQTSLTPSRENSLRRRLEKIVKVPKYAGTYHRDRAMTALNLSRENSYKDKQNSNDLTPSKKTRYLSSSLKIRKSRESLSRESSLKTPLRKQNSAGSITTRSAKESPVKRAWTPSNSLEVPGAGEQFRDRQYVVEFDGGFDTGGDCILHVPQNAYANSSSSSSLNRKNSHLLDIGRLFKIGFRLSPAASPLHSPRPVSKHPVVSLQQSAPNNETPGPGGLTQHEVLESVTDALVLPPSPCKTPTVFRSLSRKERKGKHISNSQNYANERISISQR